MFFFRYASVRLLLTCARSLHVVHPGPGDGSVRALTVHGHLVPVLLGGGTQTQAGQTGQGRPGQSAHAGHAQRVDGLFVQDLRHFKKKKNGKEVYFKTWLNRYCKERINGTFYLSCKKKK